MEKICSFFGHRSIEKTDALAQLVRDEIVDLIKNHNVKIFLFGSRSEFDTLCYEAVTELQKLYPDMKRIAFTRKSEYACKKGERERLERIARSITNMDIVCQDYDGVKASKRVYNAGRASYVERNQEMINASDFCVFYYNPDYLPPKRKRDKGDMNGYQPKSGTRLAFDYACQRKRGGKNLTIVNLFEK